MKKNLFKLLSLVAIVLFGWACETDYYNEHYLDGYEPDDEITDVQSVEYTLAAADYAAIASNATNKAIAEAAGAEAVKALNAVKTNGCFASAEEAQTYIKAFVASKYDYYLSNGSGVSVTYRLSKELPEELQRMRAAKACTLKDEAYAAAWEGAEKPVNALTPATIGKLAEIVSNTELQLAAGEYAAVTYNWMNEEPTVGGGDEPVEPAGYTSILGSAKLDDEVEVKGYVSAVCTQGVIVTDNTGSILVYKASGLAVGDEVTATGKISAFNNGFQLDTSKGAAIEKTGTTTVAYPAPVAPDGAAFDKLLEQTTNEYAKYVKIECTVTVSGTYYNFSVEGSEKATGSFYGLSNDQKAELKDGDKVTLYGYFSSISKSGGVPKFVNIIVVSLNNAPVAANDYTSLLGSAKLDDEVEVKGYVSAVCTQGVIVTDNAGSILVYKASGLAVGDEVTATGKISAFNNGFQLDTSKGAAIEKTGTTTVAYPAPVALDGAAFDKLLEQTTNEYAKYVKIEGTVAVSGNYYNFNVEGAEKATGSFYGLSDDQKAQLANGEKITFYGYFSSISKSGGAPKFVNVIVTSVEGKAAVSQAALAAAAAEKRYALLQWNGSAFTVADVATVQPADYAEMGVGSYFSAPAQDTYLPKFLGKTYPYAMADQEVYAAYKVGSEEWSADAYTYDGSAWVKNGYVVDAVMPYVKTGNAWMFNPNRTIVLNPDKSEYSKKYYQAVVDWVYDNKNEKYTYDNRSDSRTTDAEYYSGCAAGYTNLNWRINTLPKYYWSEAGEDITAYEKYTSDDVAESKAAYAAFYKTAEEHFAEAMAAALGVLHADQQMVPDVETVFTIQMMLYTQHIGSSTGRVTHAFEFKLVDNGKFEYVRMYALEDRFELMKDSNWE